MAKRKDALPAEEPAVEQEVAETQEVESAQTFEEMAQQEVADDSSGEAQVEQEATPEPVQADAWDWRDEIGIEALKGVDPKLAAQQIKQAFQYTHSAVQENRRLQAELQAGLAAKAEYEKLYKELQAQRIAPADPPRAPEKTSPTFKPEWEEYLDATSADGFAADTPRSIKAEVGKYRRDFGEWQRKLYSDPESVLTPIIENRLKSERETFEKRINELQAQAEQQQQRNLIEGLFAQAPMLGVADQSGRLQRDPITGMPVLSEHGHKFNQLTGYLNSIGITNPEAQVALAAKLMQADAVIAGQNGQFATNPVPAVDPKQALLDRGRQASGANRVPQRGQSHRVANDTGTPQNNRLSFAQMLNAELGSAN